ncbi:MAG: NAD(P)/FAD-dependent oxidoreductase [Thermoflexaceae bacterium]|nr:NAD(P)/FAD-dependent oxidoreductase [Thermoflexaceae bacterium]
MGSDLVYDALVLGGGPAGLAAAVQLARFNRSVLVFDGGGGRSSYHQVNHNYLGFPGGISIRDFRRASREQAARLPVAFIDEEAAAVSRQGSCFVARTAAGIQANGRTVVFATGVRDRFPDFPGWESYVGRSIFWCIVCDGYSTRGRRIVVVANDDDGGVTALQFLQFTSHVTVLSNAAQCGVGAKVRGELQARGIRLVEDEIAGVLGHDGILGAVQLKRGGTLEADYLFSLQGSNPASDLAAGLGCERSALGYIVTDMEQRTNVPGVFAAGDVTRDLAHQVATAVHEGITAATTANYSLYAAWQRHERYRE